jgi:hypothetical protein
MFRNTLSRRALRCRGMLRKGEAERPQFPKQFWAGTSEVFWGGNYVLQLFREIVRLADQLVELRNGLPGTRLADRPINHDGNGRIDETA